MARANHLTERKTTTGTAPGTRPLHEYCGEVWDIGNDFHGPMVLFQKKCKAHDAASAAKSLHRVLYKAFSLDAVATKEVRNVRDLGPVRP